MSQRDGTPREVQTHCDLPAAAREREPSPPANARAQVEERRSGEGFERTHRLPHTLQIGMLDIFVEMVSSLVKLP